jgi:hypothetical protein
MSEERRVQDAALVMSPPWHIVIGGALPFAFFALLAYAAHVPALYPGAAVFGFLGALVSLGLARGREYARGELTVAADACRIGGFTIERSAIRRARIIAAEDGRTMVVLTRGALRRPIGLVMDLSDAEPVVKQLRLDVANVRDRFTTRLPGNLAAALLVSAGRIGAIFIGVLALVAQLDTSTKTVVALPALGLAVLLSLPTGHVDVGPDGVTVRWYFSTWHIPLAKLTGIRRISAWRFHVLQNDGPPIAVEFQRDRRGLSQEGAAFEWRINELLTERDGATPELIETFEALARNGRVRINAQTFRTAGFALTDALRILRDGRVRAATRARAALAIEDKEELIRIAAQTTHPRLRVALEKAARGEEIEAEISELEREYALAGARG